MLAEEGAPLSGLASMKPFQVELKPCFGSWGDTKPTKAGLPGQSLAGFEIPAPARELRATPRGSAGSCFLPKAPLPWGPQDACPKARPAVGREAQNDPNHPDGWVANPSPAHFTTFQQVEFPGRYHQRHQSQLSSSQGGGSRRLGPASRFSIGPARKGREPKARRWIQNSSD